ncbi:MAG: nicotinate-nucleotide--dimethylbenzimidazole phosphoribosyltransferase [Gordonia sp. (in: high G+C Gram-positive bacteria)]|uniref:nicotinate-nucleotide--dimethylbenzimidazole phosphoribosyltransferase n=1 Tax=Gordonia sp. (in: high G+C Gram-positive bacteria) TaxID=84139 RepID=UPI0039E4D05C
MRTLVLGGIGSGKTAYAESLLDGHDDVHRIGGDVAAELTAADPGSPALVEDLGAWIGDRLTGKGAPADPSAEITALCEAIAAFAGEVVIVSPEAGLSVATAAAGRRLQEVTGRVNAAVARVCENVDFVVAGRPLARSAQSPADAPSSPAATPVIPEVPAAAPVAALLSTGDGTSHTEAVTTDAEVFDAVDLPDPAVAEQARDRLATLVVAPGSLGRIADLAAWVASCQGACPPRPIAAPQVVVFAGDHGVSADGVSAYPREVTAQMVRTVDAGGAAINVLARRAGAGVQVLDLSVDAAPGTFADHVARFKVSRGSGDLRRGEAMSLADARRGVAAGRRVADGLVDAGADLLIAGDLGVGDTTPGATLIGVITGKEPVTVVGRGSGIDDNAWIRKTAAIRDGMRFGRPHRHDPLSLLAAVGGPDIAATAGFLAQAALRKTPVILDGMVTSAAALIAEMLAPGASAWWTAGHLSPEPAHAFALTELGLTPILDMAMNLGDGSGAVTALPLVAAAVDVLADTATRADAGVADSLT